MRYGDILLRMARLALRRPRAVAWIVSTGWRLRARDWYRRAPFLPLPPREYVAWRLHTAYGTEDRVPDAAELERYLGWAAWMRRAKER